MNEPVIHAVVPVYNNGATLRAALDSLLAEALIRRVQVVDDGSTDNCCDRLDDAGDRVKVTRQENAGPGAARNRGMEAALADEEMTHVLLLDADDMLQGGDHLREAEKLLEEHHAAAVISAREEILTAEGGRLVLRQVPAAWAGGTLPCRGLVFSASRFFGASGVLLPRAVISAGIRFDTSLMIGEDRDFLYRVQEVGPVAVYDKPLLRVTIHDSGENLTGPKRLQRWLRDNLTLVARYGNDAESAQYLRETSAWLIGHASRELARRGEKVDGALWHSYRSEFEKRGWKFPLRARRWRYRGACRGWIKRVFAH